MVVWCLVVLPTFMGRAGDVLSSSPNPRFLNSSTAMRLLWRYVRNNIFEWKKWHWLIHAAFKISLCYHPTFLVIRALCPFQALQIVCYYWFTLPWWKVILMSWHIIQISLIEDITFMATNDVRYPASVLAWVLHTLKESYPSREEWACKRLDPLLDRRNSYLESHKISSAICTGFSKWALAGRAKPFQAHT